MLLPLLPTVMAPASAEDARESTRAANRELAAIVEQLNALDSWLNDAEAREAGIERELRDADQAVARIGRAVADLAEEADALRTRLAELATQADTLRAEQSEQRDRIAQHLSAAQRLAGQDFLKLLLNQEDPEEFDRMLRYHQYFSRARVELLSDYRATMAEIATNEAATQARAAELDTREADLVAERSALDGRRTERERRLRTLKSERATRIDERKRLQADQRRLRELLAELARRSETLAGREFAQRAGALPWPVRGDLRSRFGEPRAEGRLRWQGNFFAAPADAPVRAVHRGKVVFAEWLRGFGLLTIIDHGNEYMTLYGYADVLLKQPGDRVESGEQIATAGRSGGQDLDGLYFEVRKAGAAVDPASWLAPGAP